MTPTPEIEHIVDQAVKIAQQKQHEYVTTEHLLLSMIRFAPFRKTADAFGVASVAFVYPVFVVVFIKFERVVGAYLYSFVFLYQVMVYAVYFYQPGVAHVESVYF